MHIDENDATELKGWVIQKLTGISDADSDVLADYVCLPTLHHKACVQLEDSTKVARVSPWVAFRMPCLNDR